MRYPLSILCALSALLVNLSASATIHTVHNDPLYNAEYSNVTTAFNAASPYDTLLVHGSPNGYGTVVINKPITILGPGHNPDNGERASFTTIQLLSGADSCYFEGLSAQTFLINNVEVTITRCRITSSIQLQANADEALVRGNVFDNGLVDVNSAASNVEIAHNFFSQSGSTDNFRGGSSTTLVHHNVFVKTNTSASSSNEMFEGSTAFTVFADNVFLTATLASFNIGDCPNYVYQNNLTFSDAGSLPSLGPNNLDNTAPTWSLASGSPLFDYDDDYSMLSGTPLTGASDGGQVGVMGGNFPLQNDGRPRNIPYVTSTQLETPYVPENGTIDVNFQAEQGQP